jgi:hypothetical protein
LDIKSGCPTKKALENGCFIQFILIAMVFILVVSPGKNRRFPLAKISGLARPTGS